MRGGDLDNTPNPRWLVTLDAVVGDYVLEKPRLKRMSTYVEEIAPLCKTNLLRLWQYTLKIPVDMDLVFTNNDETFAEQVWDYLDNRLTNPFHGFLWFPDRETLARQLAYRPDVVMVADLNERFGHYGTKGIAIERLLSGR